MCPKLTQIILLQQMNTYLKKSPVDSHHFHLANIPT